MAAQLVPFSFESNEIRAAQDDHSAPWFVAKDICTALGISWSSATLNPIKTDWKGMMKFITPGGEQELAVIREQAVYKLAFRSRKPEAERFTDWVAEVIATIRKTGGYVHPNFRPEKTRKALPGGLTLEQQDAVKALVASRVAALPHGSQAGAAIKCWSSIKSKFGVGYKQVPAECFGDVLSLVARLELDKPAALPRPDGRYCFPASFWKVAPHDRAGFLTWQDLVNARPRPLPDLFARLAEDGHDIEGARIEYLAMRHILELQNLILSNVARDVLSYPHRGLGFDFR